MGRPESALHSCWRSSRGMASLFSSIKGRTMELASILGNVDNVGKGHHLPHFRDTADGGLTTAVKMSTKYDDNDYARWGNPTVLNTHHVATLASTWGPESWGSQA